VIRSVRHTLSARQAAALLLAVALGIGGTACKKIPGLGQAATSGGSRADGLFLAQSPALIPEEILPDIQAMGIGRVYIAGARITSSGQIEAYSPPPNRIELPTIFVLMGDEGSSSTLSGTKGELIGEGWATGLVRPLAEARSWANVVGLHLHVIPKPEQAEVLAGVLKALKRAVGLPVSVTLPAGAPAGSWKPLADAADEALLFAQGRRPETGDTMVPEPNEEEARGFPLPFRLLSVPGGYGRGGTGDAPSGRRISDGEIDRLSEDKGLDFNFEHVLSNEPGSLYGFSARPGVDSRRTLLAQDGGAARFQLVAFSDVARLVSAAGRWAGAPIRGRVFMVDGVPNDGHLLGFPAIKALLTGEPYAPSLKVTAVPRRSKESFEFSLNVVNDAPTPTDLSHFDNWVQVRVEGGVIASVVAGDFDRYEVFASLDDKRPAPFGRATVVRFFENLFAPFEAGDVGPIRLAGSRPKVFVKAHLVLTDGQVLDPPESELAFVMPTPEPKAEPPSRKKKK
jgi:hypothetical protein